MNPPTTVNSGVTTSSFFVLHGYWIIIDPGSGATATVEYTTGTANDVAGSHATWVTQGAYTTRTALKVEEDLQGLYFRITAASGSIDYSVNGELSEADRLTLRSYAKAVVNQLGGGSASAAALAPVSLSANTTLTRAAHYNRLIVVDVSGGNVTLTATGTDALLGDFISVDVIGGGSNTVTLAGVTAQSGYQLTAVSGGNVEARCDVAASFIASTRTISAGAGATATLALADGDFTANNLNLTATHTNRVLDCSAVTIPVTLTIQTDASGGYDTTAAELKVLGSLTAPVAIIKGTGATLVGGVQVIEQGGWGGARRTSANTWAIVGQRKSGLSLGSTLSQFGISAPGGWGLTSLHNNWITAPSLVDSCTSGAANNQADGGSAYGFLRRIRYTGAASANKGTGIQHILNARLDNATSMFPMVFSAGMPDSIVTAPVVIGMCNSFSVGTGLNSVEPSASSTLDLIAVAADSGDANMQIMHRTGGGAGAVATKVDLGAAFPKAKWNAYELSIYKNNAGTAFTAVVRNLVTGAVAVKCLTTNLPRNTQDYHSIFIRSSWGGASAALDYINTITGASS